MAGHTHQASGRIWSIIATTTLLAATVALVGAFAGPQWNAAPVSISTPVLTSDPQITTAQGTRIQRPDLGTYEVRRSELSIDLGDVVVPAWYIEPVDAPAGPGVVFIHGAGTVGPGAFQAQVNALASSGVRALVPAKRMDTYSTRHRDYPAMANDYLRSWQVLRELPGVDPTRVGLYAESEGAWIAPIAAATEPRVQFVILASAPVVSPREQAAYAVTNYLRNTNVPRGLFRSVPRALGATIPGGGFDYIDFDVRPYYEKVRQPVLMLYGTQDASMPIVQGDLITREHLGVGGNTALVTRYINGADHGLKRSGTLAPEVNTILADWVWGLPATAHSHAPVAGGTPTQRYLAEPVPAPRWYASGNFLVYSALAAGGASLLGVGLCSGSARRARQFTPVSRYSIATVLAAFATLVIFTGYIAQVAELALNYRNNDLLVRGGWVLVQGSGVLTAGLTAGSLRHLARPANRAGWTPITRLGVWLCHLGTLALLLIGAYWGLFPVSW